MLRGMIFVDHMNYDIALQAYYKSLDKQTIKLDYNNSYSKTYVKIGSIAPVWYNRGF